MLLSDKRKELIKYLVDNYAGANLSDYLAKCLDEIEDMKKAHTKYLYNRQKMEDRHKQELKALDVDWFTYRKKCRHLSTTFHGDPCGGSDSFSTCDICGSDC